MENRLKKSQPDGCTPNDDNFVVGTCVEYAKYRCGVEEQCLKFHNFFGGYPR